MLGYLRLAYLALEVSIHRRIICQITSSHATNLDPNVLSICRSAARTRFVSALEFVDSLKAQHLTSFWYFSSSPCLALLISFGNLLLGSATEPEEKQFYASKMKEFRWKLKLNGEAGAKFMKPALSAMVLDPDDLSEVKDAEPTLGAGTAAVASNTTFGFSPSADPDGRFFANTGLTPTGPTAATMSPWQGATPGYGTVVNSAVPDMQEYVNSFAWTPLPFNNHFPGT